MRLLTLQQAIKAFKYRAIAVSPEKIMKPNGEFEQLLKNPLFTLHIISIVVDKAHYITEWGEFCLEYKELGCLHYILPSTIPIMITSATLTQGSLTNAMRLLHMHTDKMSVICRSSDRANIKIDVRKIKYSLTSYTDLAFLILPGWNVGNAPPPKFMIFFDNIQDAINATWYLHSRLPPAMWHKIKWFNSDMTSKYKELELTNLISGDCWGFCTIDLFGMVSTTEHMLNTI